MLYIIDIKIHIIKPLYILILLYNKLFQLDICFDMQQYILIILHYIQFIS